MGAPPRPRGAADVPHGPLRAGSRVSEEGVDAATRVQPEGAAALREEGVLDGGMIPKIDAALRAAERGVVAHVANGRLPHTLERIASGEAPGTRVRS